MERPGQIPSKLTQELLFQQLVMAYDISTWDEELEMAVSNFKNTYQYSSLSGLALVQEIDEYKIGESFYIFPKFIELRKSLSNKNRQFKGLASRFVTNEIIEN